mgnify:CR=1 FL=1
MPEGWRVVAAHVSLLDAPRGPPTATMPSPRTLLELEADVARDLACAVVQPVGAGAGIDPAGDRAAVGDQVVAAIRVDLAVDQESFAQEGVAMGTLVGGAMHLTFNAVQRQIVPVGGHRQHFLRLHIGEFGSVNPVGGAHRQMG